MTYEYNSPDLTHDDTEALRERSLFELAVACATCRSYVQALRLHQEARRRVERFSLDAGELKDQIELLLVATERTLDRWHTGRSGTPASTTAKHEWQRQRSDALSMAQALVTTLTRGN